MKITLREEKRLVRAANAGNAGARARLAAVWANQVHGLAKKVHHSIDHSDGHRIEVEDLAGEAWIEIWRLLPRYRQGSLARPLSWMHDWIIAAMCSYACANLEIVSLPRCADNHAAHRELERGGDLDEIAQRRSMSAERVRSLIRHTVSIQAARALPEHDVLAEVEDASHRMLLAAQAFGSLSSRQRFIVSSLRAGMSRAEVSATIQRLGFVEARSDAEILIDHAVVTYRRQVRSCSAAA